MAVANRGIGILPMVEQIRRTEITWSSIRISVAAANRMELTADSQWEWSLVPGEARWHDSLGTALAEIDLPTRRLEAWPQNWRVFFTREASRELRASGARDALPPPDSGELARVPDALEIGGRTLERTELAADEKGLVDLARHVGQAFDGRTALAYATLDLETDAPITVFAGADYWMQWWVDGLPVFDTLEGGNRSGVLERAHSFPLTLAAGKHVLAVRIISGSGGWSFASEATWDTGSEVPVAFGLAARRVFQVDDPAAFASLDFDGGDRPDVRLNGQPIPVPLAGMHYENIPGIPASLLHQGQNELTKSWAPEQVAISLLPLAHFLGAACGERPTVRGRLFGWRPGEAELQTGPLLGWASRESVTVTCRTTAPLEISLELNGDVHRSGAGLIHRFAVSGLQAGTRYPFELLADGTRLGRGVARTLPGPDALRVVILGDVYPFDDTWERIAGKVLAEAPDLVIFSGDMVLDGREDAQWDAGFFGPAHELLASVPFYAVIGNHEYDCPLFDRISATPGGRNWHQEIGSLLLIGIDGARDWSDGCADFAWLDRTLGESAAPFKFFVSHYPPFSSGGHGRLGPDGLPREATIRQARDFLVPLLTKHGVRAVFSGHDHFYERSELPGGLTAIVSAGAGSRLYSKTKNPAQNPHSVIWQSDYHYCRMEIAAEECTLEAVALDGSIIDRKRWR